MENPLYPFSLNPDQEFAVGDRDETIKSAIAIILLTPKGYREVFSEFGSECYKILYLNADTSDTNVLIDFYITEALGTWLPEIKILSISKSWGADYVIIGLEYEDLLTGDISNQDIIFNV